MQFACCVWWLCVICSVRVVCGWLCVGVCIEINIILKNSCDESLQQCGVCVNTHMLYFRFVYISWLPQFFDSLAKQLGFCTHIPSHTYAHIHAPFTSLPTSSHLTCSAFVHSTSAQLSSLISLITLISLISFFSFTSLTFCSGFAHSTSADNHKRFFDSLAKQLGFCAHILSHTHPHPLAHSSLSLTTLTHHSPLTNWF